MKSEVTNSTATAPDRADSPDAKLGAALRARRLEKGLRLQDIAARADVSVGMLSQLERGLSSPPLKVLREICAALELPMTSLFETPETSAEGVIVRAHERRRLEIGTKGMVKELLNRDDGTSLQGMLVTIAPGGGSGGDSYAHDGEEIGHVLQGTLSIRIGTRSHTLSAGDTFCFQSTIPHSFENVGPDVASVLWVVSKAFY